MFESYQNQKRVRGMNNDSKSISFKSNSSKVSLTNRISQEVKNRRIKVKKTLKV